MAKRSREEDSLSSRSGSEPPITLSVPSTASPSATREVSAAPTERSLKYTQLDEDPKPATPALMICHLPPHESQAFPDYEAYEVHYQKYHVHRCSECARNFPSNHYLELHISENHDPLSDVKRERGEKTYGCFVPGCEKLCSTAGKRRLHCRDKHDFPELYDYFIVNEGMDNRTSMLRRPPASNAQQRRNRAWKPKAGLATTKKDDGPVPRQEAAAGKNATSPGGGGGGADAMAVTSSTGGLAASKHAPTAVAKSSSEEGNDSEDSDSESESESESDSEFDSDSDADGDVDASKDHRDTETKTDKGTQAGKSPKPKMDVQKNAAVKPGPGATDIDMDAVTKSMSSLRFVPRSLQFGRGKGKAGFSRR